MNQQQILEARKRFGIPEGGIETPPSPAIANIARRRQMAADYDVQNKPGFLQRVGTSLKERGEGIKQTFKETVKEKLDPVSTAVRVVGDVAGGITDVGMAALSPMVEKLAQTETGKEIFGVLAKGMESYETWKNSSESNRKAGEVIEGVLNIADLAGSAELVGIGGKVAFKAGKETLKQGLDIAEEGVEMAGKATRKVIKAVEPPPLKPIEAVKQVLQGKTPDLKPGIKALSEVSLEGVKTFDDLFGKMKKRTKELIKEVDADLALDTTKRKLDELRVFVSGKVGTAIKNPVETALNHLDELYDKIGDTVESLRIKDLIKTAKEEGLDNAQINNIAREYGSKFGSKAFGKTGEALTSVNAQLYENIRTAVKDFARQGIKGQSAKLADEAMSSIIKTEKLIKNNIEAVNKLRQKIQQRGLLEKVGHIVSKYGNILTGGTLRGFIGGLLPRGAGYKVMNALDIEEALSKNLKIIQDAIKSGSDEEIVKILKSLE